MFNAVTDLINKMIKEKSLQELEKLLQGARDDSDFKQWRDKIKEEQLQEQLNKVKLKPT